MRVLGMTFDELVSDLGALGEPAYRAGQVFSWLHERNEQSFLRMTDLPKALRETLASTYEGDRHEVVEQTMDEEATKALIRLSDGSLVESVLMGRPWGNAACLSSQIGCPVGCAFCASGQGGLVRGLRAGEIVAQLAELRRMCESLGHVVLMGMGEPLLNLRHVIRALLVLTDKRGLGLPQRNITVSTIGLLPGIEELARSGLRVRLALSLHATNDEARSSLIPPEWCAPLDEVIAAALDYSRRSRRRLTFAYVLMAGSNDSRADAGRLAALARQAHAHVNVIPYNEVDGAPFIRPSRERVAGFMSVLEESGVQASVRVSIGRRADAACGQLRARHIAT